MLAEVKRQIGVPVLTDVHTEAEIADAAAVVDVLQTPAFLCRQTDFIHAVARAGKPVNIKKGQFLAPEDMKQVVAKAKAASGADNIMVCERGASFGYHNLVSDMRSAGDPARDGLPGRVRRDALGAASGRRRNGKRRASASSSRCSRARRSPPGSRACSWKRTRIRTRRSPTGPTPGRSRGCARCSRR